MYILFRCDECNHLMAWLNSHADGHRCNCGGHLLPADKGEKQELIQKFSEQEISFFNSNKPKRKDGLTIQEGKAMDALIVAWNEFSRLDMTHPSDMPDFANGIHQCQQILGMRVLQRIYPEGYPVK